MSRTCPACETPLSEEYRYCLNCGKDFGAVTVAAEEPPATLVYQGTPPSLPKQPIGETQPARKSNLPWILVTVCLVIISFLAALLLFGPGKQRQELQTQLSPSTQTSPTPLTTPTIEPTPTPKNSNQNSTPSDPADANVAKSQNSSQGNISTLNENRVFSESEVDYPAKISSKPSPLYTEEARANNIKGLVILKVVLTADGEVTSIRVVKGLPHGLTEQAIIAARQLKFTKAMRDGRPVSMSMIVEYSFNIY